MNLNLKKVVFVFFFLFLLTFSVNVFGHEGEEGEKVVVVGQHENYLPFDSIQVTLYSFILIVIVSAIGYFKRNNLQESHKNFLFYLTTLLVLIPSFYLLGSTVYLNVISETQGPVHWHADFEIWLCGEKIENLIKSEGLSNKVGTSVFHHHNDFKLHVEGLLIKKSDASLKAFFKSIGGEFDGEHLTVPLTEGSFKTVQNGLKCPNGETGKLSVWVKKFEKGIFEETPEKEKYVLSPFFDVPPGDEILIVFDSEKGTQSLIEQKNSSIRGEN